MPRFRWILTVVVVTSFFITACSPDATNSKGAPVEAELTACTDPRPQICTADYNPVCGSLGGDSHKTFSNGCSACSDAAVSGHRPGACE